MPYLTCPDCHLSVFRAPLDLRPAECPRCGTSSTVDARRHPSDTPGRFRPVRPTALATEPTLHEARSL